MGQLTFPQKGLAVSACIAVFSMFLPWMQLGVRSDDGWETQYFLVLLLWVWPYLSVFRNREPSFGIIWYLVVAFGLILSMFFDDHGGVSLFGRTVDWRVGAGVWVYLLANALSVYFLWKNVVSPKISDGDLNEFYLQASSEFESGVRDEGLWVRCLAKSHGDENKAKYDYIDFLVQQRYEEKLRARSKADKEAFNGWVSGVKSEVVGTSEKAVSKGVKGIKKTPNSILNFFDSKNEEKVEAKIKRQTVILFGLYWAALVALMMKASVPVLLVILIALSALGLTYTLENPRKVLRGMLRSIKWTSGIISLIVGIGAPLMIMLKLDEVPNIEALSVAAAVLFLFVLVFIVSRKMLKSV
jgi:hypothetical protein